ncbi:MAG: right-handed parallel beta-helix repeat-containing protein [Eubacteriales bacterium]|nr:right-handed parallel beta-helix repeat-containing protein [Eubacteriales bacterium]
MKRVLLFLTIALFVLSLCSCGASNRVKPLPSVQDGKDVTDRITSKLMKDGFCQLGPGDFYVSGIDMPDDSCLIGCGPATKLILIGTDATEGYAISMGSRCTIKDMSICGTEENTLSTIIPNTYFQRHGIVWQGDANDSATNIPTKGTISGCYIYNFSGGGITCDNTGYSISSGINVSDCYIWSCYAGINVDFWSEFSKWNNISATNCHYGAINNGGNQVFTNCNFSGNTVGMLIDNSKGQSKNNSHGSISNCIFDHSDGNTGVGIKLMGVSNGELFSNCQLFFSSVEIDNCKGISMSNFDFGYDTSKLHSGEIIVKNHSFVIFDKFLCRTTPQISVDNTSTAIMTDCFTWEGEPITILP